MARPPKAEDDRANAAFRVRLRASERRQLEAKATEAGVSLSQIIRAAVFRYRPPSPPIVREAVDELHRVGVNLNQLMHFAHATGELGPEGQAAVKAAMEAIIGATDRLLDYDMRRR